MTKAARAFWRQGFRHGLQDRDARRGHDRGVVLVYVLVVLAVASALVVTMAGQSDRAIDRTRGFADAAQAEALIRAAEASALAALARDPREVDHAAEDWARVAQEDMAIAGGRFQMQISDAQGLFNLANLAGGGVLAQGRLGAVVAAAGLDDAVAFRLIAAFAGDTPPRAMADLALVLTAEEIQALAPWVTLLPASTDVNLNSAPEPLMVALLGNEVQARKLAVRRDSAGYLTAADAAEIGVILPPGLGFTSDHFRLTTLVQSGEAMLSEQSLISRAAGTPQVVWRLAAPPGG